MKKIIFIAFVIVCCIIIKAFSEISYYFHIKNIGHSAPLNVPVSENVEYDNGMYTVFLDVNNMKPDIAKVPLSMLIEGCSLVQLEYKQGGHRIFFTTITEKYIGVCCSEREFYKLFDRSGKFLCHLELDGAAQVYSGKQIRDDIIDDKNELVYLASSGNKIHVYQTSGAFVKNIFAPHVLVKPKLFLYNNILTVMDITTNKNDNKKPMMLQFDVNTGKLLNELTPPEHLVSKKPTDGLIYSKRNTSGKIDCGIRYNPSRKNARDTLYNFDGTDNMILPVFTTSYSSARFPQYKPYSFRLNQYLILSAIWFEGLIATDLNSQTSSWVKFRNDYFGNMPVSDFLWNDSEDFRNGYYVHNIRLEKLIYDMNKRLDEEDCTIFDKMRLGKMISNMKKWNNNENNVVFWGKLKSETKIW